MNDPPRPIRSSISSLPSLMVPYDIVNGGNEGFYARDLARKKAQCWQHLFSKLSAASSFFPLPSMVPDDVGQHLCHTGQMELSRGIIEPKPGMHPRPLVHAPLATDAPTCRCPLGVWSSASTSRSPRMTLIIDVKAPGKSRSPLFYSLLLYVGLVHL